MSKLVRWSRRCSTPERATAPTTTDSTAWRICRLEPLERRLPMAGDLFVGAVYLEPGSEPSGIDQFGNTLTITWQGGVVGTQLTRLVIDTDVDGDGRLTRGETFFDTLEGGLGAPGFGAFPFTLVEHAGFETRQIAVLDGGPRLAIDFDGFDPGERLVFRIDVDEATNSGANAVAEGEEFADSILSATFEHVDYAPAVARERFVDFFDQQLIASGLPLPSDRYTAPSEPGVPIFTAGALAHVTQEPLLGSLSGRIHYDAGADAVYTAVDQLLSGVRVQLRASDGNLVTTTTTDPFGLYRFDDLWPGIYSIAEIQPLGYAQGDSRVGSLGGIRHSADIVDHIVLAPNRHGEHYDFWETLPNSIRGRVHVDRNGNDDYDPGETGLAGVVIELLAVSGAVLDRTLTDAGGEYWFRDLPEGTYGVREMQPLGYVDGAEHIGTAGGVVLGNDWITQIVLVSSTHGAGYDFSETLPTRPPERSFGTLSGYVFQDGGEHMILAGVDDPQRYANTNDGQFTADDTPLAGVTLILADAAGVPLLDGQGRPLRTVTDTAGYYNFGPLQPASYSVIEVQPDGYVDGRDLAGPGGGFARHPGDEIRRIIVVADREAEQNNFSELRIRAVPFIVPPARDVVGTTPRGIVPEPTSTSTYITPLVGATTYVEAWPYYGAWSSGSAPLTWHLSVINGGRPRADRIATVTVAARRAMIDWDAPPGTQASWKLRLRQGTTFMVRKLAFGVSRGVPVVGDFNGDGISDLALFVAGEWFVDLNGNGVWDEDDLWARLGRPYDQPVAGDWDGDGKTDIGVYGRPWPGDLQALLNEPGLPDPDNAQFATRKKNLPPTPHTAPLDPRTMQRTAQGQLRSDLIDHVFAYGQQGDQAVVGDWNGSGVDAIGVFRDGQWQLDIDGDGQLDADDATFTYGQSGDRPLVGDFNGDGIDEIGVYRDGQWYLDLNGDRRLDARDYLLQFGEEGDVPVVGDFDGDGQADAGLFTTQDEAAP